MCTLSLRSLHALQFILSSLSYIRFSLFRFFFTYARSLSAFANYSITHSVIAYVVTLARAIICYRFSLSVARKCFLAQRVFFFFFLTWGNLHRHLSLLGWEIEIVSDSYRLKPHGESSGLPGMFSMDKIISGRRPT